MVGVTPTESLQCVQCESFVDRFSVFICKGCRRTPLCESHRDPELKLCDNCSDRLRRKRLRDLKRGLRSLGGFMLLMQFLFLIIALIFTAQRLMPETSPAFVWDNFFVRYIYLWGAFAAIGVFVVYLLQWSQRRNINKLSARLRSTVSIHRYR